MRAADREELNQLSLPQSSSVILKRVLFVCTGNTCRSPMAKTILEQMLKGRGLESEISVDSAGLGAYSHSPVTPEAKEAIKQLYDGKDLLANHISKSVNEISFEDFHLILTMAEDHKHRLPKDKTYTLKEYAGLKGDISDPIGQGSEVYRECRDEIKNCLDRALPRIIKDC